MLCDGMSEEIIPELLGCHIRLAFLEFPVYLPEPGGEVQWLVVDLIGFCGMPFTDDNALPVPVPEFGYDFGFCRAVNELPVGSRFLTTCSYADLWLHPRKKILQVQVLAGFSVLLSPCGASLAEREGFEPPVQLPVHRISSAARSTTPASLQCPARKTFRLGLQI